MQHVHPINTKTCKGLIGKPVLLLLNNGNQLYGVVSRIANNKLVLNDNSQAKLRSTTPSSKKTVATKSMKQRISTDTPPAATEQLSSFGLPLFGGPAPTPRTTGPIDVELTYIAALFTE